MASNTASKKGGGIYDEGGSVELASSSVVYNRAEKVAGSGAGIHNEGGTFTLAKSFITFNTPENCFGLCT